MCVASGAEDDVVSASEVDVAVPPLVCDALSLGLGFDGRSMWSVGLPGGGVECEAGSAEMLVVLTIAGADS